ncbi:calponin [Cryomyces antarcticus]
MTSVTSLDQDMRNLRLSRYTPQAANEVRSWIEDTLGESLPGGDLLDALKDGVVLCKLANLAIAPPGIKFKKSSMPFIQMENISHFLRACEAPPLHLPAHDRFLTVDLFESKDPTQVLQCLGAFSRRANAVNPSRFPTTIGPKRAGALSPSTTGATNGGLNAGAYGRNRGASNTSSTSSSTFNPISKPSTAVPSARAMSPALTGGSNASRATDSGSKSSAGPVSSWSKKSDEGNSSPAWNIHQYGYMGGASQGNQGVAFGARRQITSAAPSVPSLAEKERKRREQDAENERLRIQAEEAEHKRRVEREAEEEQARIEEEQRWDQETRRLREEEKRRAEEQKRQWEEQERRWKEDEEQRLREEKEIRDRLHQEAQRKRGNSDARLRGQFLSQYQKEQAASQRTPSGRQLEDTPERIRVRELERQLEEAKERERQYQLEREERLRQDNNHSHPQLTTTSRPDPASAPAPAARDPSPKDSDVSWGAVDEREYLRQQWTDANAQTPIRSKPKPLPTLPPPPKSPRPLPAAPAHSVPTSSPPPPTTRTDRFLATHPAPAPSAPTIHHPAELGVTSASERAGEDARRAASTQATKAGGWASKSLLEREMERERARQREWEEAQAATRSAAAKGEATGSESHAWDVNQYGWTGGDGQGAAGRGSSSGSGIAFGGRRQIIGPRPRP